MKARILGAAKRSKEAEQQSAQNRDGVVTPPPEAVDGTFAPFAPSFSPPPNEIVPPATTGRRIDSATTTHFFGKRYEYVPMATLKGIKGREGSTGRGGMTPPLVEADAPPVSDAPRLLLDAHRWVETLLADQSAVPLLITMGIVKLTGKSQLWHSSESVPVTFDPVATARRKSKQRLYSPGNVPESAVADRMQNPPAAIIRVLGTVDPPSVQSTVMPVPASPTRMSLSINSPDPSTSLRRRTTLFSALNDSASLVPTRPTGYEGIFHTGDGDVQITTLLDDCKASSHSIRRMLFTDLNEKVDEGVTSFSDSLAAEILAGDPIALHQVLKQYVTSAVVGVAASTKTLIVGPGTGNLSRLLGRGADLRRTTLEGDGVQILGVSSKSTQDDADCTSTIPNHIVLLAKSESEYHSAESTELQGFVKKLCTEAASGFQNRYFTRPKVGVVYILFGGVQADCQSELLHAVKNNWPIFLVESSGGFAEHLVSVLRRIEAICGNPTIDDYRSILASHDPAVAEILINGNLHIVDLGTPVNDFARAVELSIHQDETLQQAWLMYATWNKGVEYYYWLMTIFQIAVSILGIMTTAGSIIQCLMQLQFPELTDQSGRPVTNAKTPVSRYYATMSILLIILPILTSLVQAVMYQVNPGQQWVLFRRCSQFLLREIYLYRTCTRKYSIGSVVRSRRKDDDLEEEQAEGAKDEVEQTVDVSPGSNEEDEDVSDDVVRLGPGEENAEAAPEAEEPGAVLAADGTVQAAGVSTGAPVVDPLETDEGINQLLDSNWTEKDDSFSTRQQLLHKRMSYLRDKLAENIRDGLLRTDEVVQHPPPEILETGDDGYSKMTPQQYVDRRLKVAIVTYVNSSNALRREFLVMSYASYFLGTIGTFLAAVSLYQGIRSYNVQFWVSLTTSLQTWISRYLEYTRVEQLLKEHCRAKDHLSSVEHWWTQLQQPGIASDSQVNRNKLVSKVEAHITHEVEETGSQLRNLADRMQKAMESKDSEGQSAKQTESLAMKEEIATLNKIGVQLLQADNIQAALSDRTGNAAVQIHQALERVTELLVNRPMEDDALELGLKKQKEFEQMFAGNFIALNGLTLGTKMPVMVEHILADRTLKQNFSDVFKLIEKSSKSNQPPDTSRLGLLEIVKSARKELFAAVQHLPHRRFLHVMRSLLEDMSLNRFEDAIKLLDLSLYDLVSMRSEAELVMAELGYIASTPWKDQKLSELVGSIHDEGLKTKVKTFGEAKLRAVLKRAESFFSESAGPSIVMLNTVVNKIAALDVTEIYSNVLTMVMRCNLCDRVLRGIDKMPPPKKQAIIEMLPPCARIKPEVITQSTTQLMAYFKYTVYNFFELNIMRAVAFIAAPETADLFSFSAIEDDQMAHQDVDTEENKKLPACMKTSEGLVRFFYCVEGLNAEGATKWSKATLLRSFSTGPFYSVDIANDFKSLSFARLEQLAIITRGAFQLTYENFVFKKILAGPTGVNLEQRLQTARVISSFIAQIEEFRGLDLKKDEQSGEELLRRWAAPEVIRSLSDLPPDILKEVVHSSLLESTITFPLILIADALQKILLVDEKAIEKAVYAPWTALQCARVLHAWRMASVKVEVTSSSFSDSISNAIIDYDTQQTVCRPASHVRSAGNSLAAKLIERCSCFTLIDIFTGLYRKLEKESADVRKRFLDVFVYEPDCAADNRRAFIDFVFAVTVEYNAQACASPLWLVDSDSTASHVRSAFERKFRFGVIWDTLGSLDARQIMVMTKYASEEIVANGFQHLFTEICSQCMDQDLAFLFPTYLQRMTFLFLCMDTMYASPVSDAAPPIPRLSSLSSTTTSRKSRYTVVALPTTPQGTSTTSGLTEAKKSEIKKDMLERTLEDPSYGAIGSTVLALSDATVTAVIEALYKENEKSNLVWNLNSLRRRYVEKEAEKLVSFDAHMLVAAHFLHHRIQHNATKTKGLMWGFDFNVFIAVAIEDKRKFLEQLIQEDSTVTALCVLEPELAKDFFMRLKQVRKALLSLHTITVDEYVPQNESAEKHSRV